MESFNFVDLYAFLQTALGMILAYLAGRHSIKRKKKGRPPCKECGLDHEND
ncbi:MAG: hypothetical protein FWC71_10605 [Defluviitaleaceae bacterium]|nr:hypothetical protein [Defluviitaleaceae bacterium]